MWIIITVRAKLKRPRYLYLLSSCSTFTRAVLEEKVCVFGKERVLRCLYFLHCQAQWFFFKELPVHKNRKNTITTEHLNKIKRRKGFHKLCKWYRMCTWNIHMKNSYNSVTKSQMKMETGQWIWRDIYSGKTYKWSVNMKRSSASLATCIGNADQKHKQVLLHIH